MWSAECAEFAMFTLECEKDVEMELWQSHNRTVGNEAPKIVIELVIGILLPAANNYMPFVQHYKLHQLL